MVHDPARVDANATPGRRRKLFSEPQRTSGKAESLMDADYA